MRNIIAFTDGSAVVKGKYSGYGGYGAYITEEGKEDRFFSKGFTGTKTGRMEISALLCVLRQMESNQRIKLTVHSDSQYVVKAFTEGWLNKWESQKWIKFTGEEVKNVDLWKKIVEEIRKRDKLILIMKHIKSHQVNKAKKKDREELLKNPIIRGNAIADILADYKRHKKYVEDTYK